VPPVSGWHLVVDSGKMPLRAVGGLEAHAVVGGAGRRVVADLLGAGLSAVVATTAGKGESRDRERGEQKDDGGDEHQKFPAHRVSFSGGRLRIDTYRARLLRRPTSSVEVSFETIS
jgi:hypothetical protein